MSTSKANVIEKLNLMSDDLDETEIVDRLCMLYQLEHSVRRCAEEGTYSDDDFMEHFRRKKEQYN